NAKVYELTETFEQQSQADINRWDSSDYCFSTKKRNSSPVESCVRGLISALEQSKHPASNVVGGENMWQKWLTIWIKKFKQAQFNGDCKHRPPGGVYVIEENPEESKIM
ncbi:hypothetical protein, partial [Salmonella enterica]|uniref:hypothetical protein n=1 Tax=Salmonella enterica TaxID=28901 RepID=UPI00135D491A